MAEAGFMIEVVYASSADRQTLISMEASPGATAMQAIEQSGILTQFPELDIHGSKIGIFGHLCKADTLLKAGDRVEIYRQLLCDPKTSRRNRALKD